MSEATRVVLLQKYPQVCNTTHVMLRNYIFTVLYSSRWIYKYNYFIHMPHRTHSLHESKSLQIYCETSTRVWSTYTHQLHLL